MLNISAQIIKYVFKASIILSLICSALIIGCNSEEDCVLPPYGQMDCDSNRDCTDSLGPDYFCDQDNTFVDTCANVLVVPVCYKHCDDDEDCTGAETCNKEEDPPRCQYRIL